MENNTEKGLSLSTIVVFIVIIAAIIGFSVLKANKNGDTSENVENNATTTEEIATTTPTTTPPVAPNPKPTIDTGVKVIQGDGYTATLKPVYGEAPVISNFSVVKNGDVCKFTWDVTKAKRCDFLNAETKTGVQNIGSIDTIQMSDKGNYYLKCYGDGGKSATSETLSC